MNARIAELIRERIASFAYADKIGGVVRAITRERSGTTITIPVGINVTDPLECSESTLLDLVPNEAYSTVIYFEDRGYKPLTDRQRLRGKAFASQLRLVCWVNTKKLNGDAFAADKIAQQFTNAIQGNWYNSGPFLAVRHRIDGSPAKGKSLFSEYTYPEGERQYLMPPFDAFALDITTEFRIKPGCEDEVNQGDVGCWIPPPTHRRRNPSEFTCDELNDPITGLTDQQREDCLDCSGATCVGSDIRDSDGNLIAHLNDGETYTLDPVFLHYDNEADALTDNATIPTAQQKVVLDDSLREYMGNDEDTVAELVTAKRFTPSFTEDPATGLHTQFDGGDVILQNA